MRASVALVVSVSAALILLASCVPSDTSCPSALGPAAARVTATTGPVALIDPLPDEVSNGTWCTIDASGSSYANGTVEQYHWEFYLKGVLKKIYEVPTFPHMFRELGLWKIFLTITTNDNLTAQAFTAVYSVPDSDLDLMPDWWEMEYFNSTSETAEGDYDADGYTNLQEYASGTDPTVKDPGRSLLDMMIENWMYLVIAAAVVGVAVAVTYPRLKRRRKAEVKKKIEAALEIEKALEEEE